MDEITDDEFQSRNRGSFDFKDGGEWEAETIHVFPSRNRGSFDFKVILRICITLGKTCFHLVIEVLLVSRARLRKANSYSASCFHLVIEVLLVSSA